jgi:hypothetical protein
MGAALGLEVAYSVKRRLEQDHVAARFHLLSLRVRPSLAPVRTPHVTLELALPLGVDVALLRVAEAPPGAITNQRSTRPDPIVGAALAARVPLRSRLALTVQAGVDVDLTPHRWLIDAGGQSEELFTLGRFRPMLLAGRRAPIPTKPPAARTAACRMRLQTTSRSSAITQRSSASQQGAPQDICSRITLACAGAQATDASTASSP